MRGNGFCPLEMPRITDTLATRFGDDWLLSEFDVSISGNGAESSSRLRQSWLLILPVLVKAVSVKQRELFDYFEEMRLSSLPC
jgi:hypothetical protein